MNEKMKDIYIYIYKNEEHKYDNDELCVGG